MPDTPALPRLTTTGRNLLTRAATETIRIYRDPARPGSGVSRPALDRLMRDGLLTMGAYEPMAGRPLQVTDLGRAALTAGGTR